MTGTEIQVDIGTIEQEIRAANPSLRLDFTDANSSHPPALQDLPPVLLDNQVVPQRIGIDQIGSQLKKVPIMVAQKRGTTSEHAELIIRRNDGGSNATYNPLNPQKGAEATLRDSEIDSRVIYALFPGNNLSAVVHVTISELTTKAGKPVDVPTPAIAEQFRKQPSLAGSERFRAQPGLSLPVLHGNGVDAQAIKPDDVLEHLASGPVMAVMDAGTARQHTVLLLKDNGIDKKGGQSYHAYDAATGGGTYLYASRIAPSQLYALTLAKSR